MDILLIKSGSKLETDIYHKETDSKQYLNFKSCHPKHTKLSIPYNLARRVCTIVSNPDKKAQRLKELSESLTKRNYPKQVIDDGMRKARQMSRTELLKPKEKHAEDIIPYVSTFNPRNPELFTTIRQNLPILYADETMSDALQNTKFIKSKRQTPNLKKLLTRAKFKESKSNEKELCKVSKCNRPKCGLCSYLIEGSFFNFQGKKFYVNENMTCDVKNVIYVMVCNGCKEYYIGQSGDKLRNRRTVHAQQIRDPSTRQLPVSTHIDNCCKSEPKFSMFPFYKMKTETPSARVVKEKYFIKCFKPILNA